MNTTISMGPTIPAMEASPSSSAWTALPGSGAATMPRTLKSWSVAALAAAFDGGREHEGGGADADPRGEVLGTGKLALGADLLHPFVGGLLGLFL